MARKMFCLMFTFLMLTAVAAAQDITGIINGRVTDATGAVIPGVQVTVNGPAIQGVRTGISGETGKYQFLLLPEGTYTVKFDLPGFKTLVHEGIIVQVFKTTEINASLEVASTAETVTVSGESPVVDVQNATIGVNFDQTMLRDTPNSRDLWIVLGQTAGMEAVGRYDVGGSTMGSQTGFRAYGTSSQGTYNLDGIITSDGGNSAGWYFDYGSFSEMQVSAAANSAEVMTAGALTNITVKSGSNKIHGQIYADWENDHFQGTNITATSPEARICPTAAQVATFSGPCGLYYNTIAGGTVPAGDRLQRYNDFNPNIGGPIMKDKLWWFFSWRDQFSGLNTQMGLSDTSDTVFGLPTSRAAVIGGGDYTTRLRIPTLKLNWQMTPKNQFIFVWQHSRKHAPYRGGTGGNAYEYIVDSTGDQHDPSDGRKWEWQSVVSPRLTLDVKATDSQYIFPQYTHINQTPVTDSSLGWVRGGFVGSDEWDRHWDWGGNASYFKQGLLGADHNLKVGFDVYWYSLLTYHDATPGGGFSMTLANGVPSSFSIPISPYQNENSAFQDAAYVQDKFTVGRRLTLNVGVRWDRFHTYYPAQGNASNGPWGSAAALGIGAYANVNVPFSIPKTYVALFDNIVPRFDVSYDLFGNGKTALKASAGKFAWDPGTGPNANPNGGISYKFNMCSNDIVVAGKSNPCPAGVPSVDDPSVITPAYVQAYGSKLFQSGGPASAIVVDPNLSNSWSDQYTLGIEHQVVNNLGVRASFIRSFDQNPYASVNTALTAADYTPTTVNITGRSGIAGGADSQNITVYNILAADKALNTTLFTNYKGIGSNYSTAELSMTKRMSSRWSGLFSWDATHRTLGQTISNDPNTLAWGANSNEHYWTWSVKSALTFQAPYGVTLTNTFDSQKGETYPRTVSVTGLNQGTITVYAEHTGTNFYPTVNLWNFRAEKKFKVKDTQNISALFDLFNIPNSSTPYGWVTNSNSPYTFQNQITSILNPRIFRLGVRYSF